MLKNRLLNLSNREVLGILLVLFVGGSLWSLTINLNSNHANIDDWLESWLQNFSTEMFGAFLTFILLELVVGSRQQREAESKAERQLKQRLMIQIRSKDNAIALQGLQELQAHGWLEDGSLQEEYLSGANLEGANLREAKLRGANLLGANLQKVNLSMAMLQGADLAGANLAGANLSDANLRGANLMNANLKGAGLGGAKLRGADLSGAMFDEKTITPDMRRWSHYESMTMFTKLDSPFG